MSTWVCAWHRFMHLAAYMHMVVLVSSCGRVYLLRGKKREVQVQPLTIMYVFLYPEEGKAAGSRRATTVTFEVSLSWIIQELKFLLFFFPCEKPVLSWTLRKLEQCGSWFSVLETVMNTFHCEVGEQDKNCMGAWSESNDF